MGGALVRSFPWKNDAYVTVVPIMITVLGASALFKLVYSRAKPSGPEPGPADCRPSQGNAMASSSEKDEKLPEGVISLTDDALYQLYSPYPEEPQIDIIFFHGLRAGDYTDAYWKSWMSSDGKSLWPQTLLANKFPTARILSVSYDSAARKTDTSGQGDLYLIAESYVENIIVNCNEPNRGNRPIILVGHSIGGLLLKKFLIGASRSLIKYDGKDEEAIKNFLANVWGAFYYSTPHNGTRLGDIASKIPESADLVLDYLKTLGKEQARLNHDFALWRKKTKVKTWSLAESLPTDPKIWGVKDMKPMVIVEEGSCRNDTDGYYTVPRSNHITICQPNNFTQGNFQKLQHFVDRCLEEKKVVMKQVPHTLVQSQQQVDDMT